jgi:hypothetical protein
MGPMIEFHIKALAEICRKGLYWRISRIERRVANGAHCSILICYPVIDELVEVTTNAGFVAGKVYLSRLSLSLVTSYAGELVVFLDRMRKLLKRTYRCTFGYRVGRLRCR